MEINKEFLKDYTPENNFFTSAKEMKLVESVLQLNDKTYEELTEIRNEVVKFYSEIMASVSREESFEYMDALQSVTAVIDNKIYRS